MNLFLVKSPPKRVSPSLIVPRVSFQPVREGVCDFTPFFFLSSFFNDTWMYCSTEENGNGERGIFEKELKKCGFSVASNLLREESSSWLYERIINRFLRYYTGIE